MVVVGNRADRLRRYLAQLDDLGFGQRRDLRLAEADLGQHLLRLRAELLRRQPHLGGLAVVQHGMIDQRQRRAGFAAAGHRHQRLHVLDLRVVGDLGIALHRRLPDLQRLHARAPVGRGRRLQPLGDQPGDLVLPGPAVLVAERSEPRLVQHLGQHLQRHQRQRHVAVLGGVHAVGRRVVPAGDVAERLRLARLGRRVGPGHQRFRLQVERRPHQAGIDAAALSGALLAHDRRQDAHREQRRAMMIDHRRAGRTRAGGRLPGDGHHAEQRLRQQVLARLLRVGSVRPVARRRGVDQLGPARLQRLVAEPQLLHHAGTEILRHHVGRIDQPQRQLAPLRRLQVDGDAALVAVGAQVQRALSVVPEVAAAPVPLPAALGGLDRDHVGAEVAQRLHAHRPEQEMIEADDPDALQQVKHGCRVPLPTRVFSLARRCMAGWES